MTILIAGAGGGGGGEQRTPVNERPVLNSNQYFNVIDIISEGEIDGLADGMKSIEFDETPLQNADGSFNFSNVQIVTREGTQNQSYVPGTIGTENEVAVGVEVQHAAPVVRTINTAGINAVRVTITVPLLQTFTEEGDTRGSQVGVRIYIQHNGGGYTLAVTDLFERRAAEPYSRDYIINVYGGVPLDIKVERDRPDSTSTNIINAFKWTSYTEIVYAKLRYPNTAYIVVRGAADQFGGVPRRSYMARGIKIQIPSNATVDRSNGRLIYSGIWDGTLGAAQWCTDPAWILWDVCIEKRYGFGDHIDISQLSKWDFYEASRYCSELVADGLGGLEPRFSCTAYITTSEEAYKLINNLASVFRAMSYWSAGAVAISQDRPSDPAFEFSLANVSPEGFSYSSSSMKTRPNVAVVSFFSNELRDIDYEVVEDAESVNRYGVIRADIEAFGCISRGQAHRLGKWLTFARQEVVSFNALIDSSVGLFPGKICKIFDPLKAGGRRSGRIAAATTITVTVDDVASTDLSAGPGSTLSVILPDGTIEERPVVSITGPLISVSPGFTTAPRSFSMWGLESPSLQSSLWRILGVGEEDGISFPVTALEYNPSAYDFIENGDPLEIRDTTNLDGIPSAPSNLTASEILFDSNGIARSKLIVSWRAVAGIAKHRVCWRRQDDNWNVQTVERNDFDILDSIPGVYEIQVYSISSINMRASASPALATVQAFGKTAAPATPTGLNIIPIDEASAILSWDRSTELDVTLGGKILVRHNVALTGALWEESQEIVAAAAGSQTQKQVPLISGSYLVKFEDDQGNRSAAAATASAALPAPQPRLLVQGYREDQETPPFSGNVTNMIYNATLDGLVLALGVFWDDIPGNIDTWTDIDGESSNKGTGEYEFGSTYDLGGIFDLNLRRYFRTSPFQIGNLWDDQTDLIDTWPSIDGSALDQVNAALYVRSTNDNPAGSPAWSPWREFANAIVRGRAYQFKMIATSEAESQNIVIDELGCELELQQRTESSATITSGAAAYAVTFAEKFYQAPSVGLTAYNMNTGDYYTVTSQTRSGFTVAFYNSTNAAVSRQFSYTATGYGREIV